MLFTLYYAKLHYVTLILVLITLRYAHLDINYALLTLIYAYFNGNYAILC